jgi:hypothetical protein
VLAQVLVPGSAQRADTAVEGRDDVHDVALRGAQVAVRLGADLEHLAADLVAEHGARLDPAVAVVERADVGAADPAGDDAQERPVRGTGRVGHFAELHLARAVPDRSSHRRAILPTARLAARDAAPAADTADRRIEAPEQAKSASHAGSMQHGGRCGG